jgi:hypothetical protein
MDVQLEVAATTPVEKTAVDNGLGFRDFVQAHAQEPDPAVDTKPSETPETATPPETPAPTPATDPKWDTAENPYKKLADDLGLKHAEVQQVSNLTQRQLAAQEREIRILRAKVDGTYTEDMETEGLPTSEEIAAESERKGRFDASRATNERLYGKDVVNRLLFAPDSPWASRYEPKAGQIPDPSVRWVHERVMSAADPIGEALKVVRLDLFFERYGGDDPDKIRQGIAAEIRADVEKTVRAQVTKELEDRLSQKRRQLPGNAEARGATQATTPKKDAGPKPLAAFGNPGLA